MEPKNMRAPAVALTAVAALALLVAACGGASPSAADIASATLAPDTGRVTAPADDVAATSAPDPLTGAVALDVCAIVPADVATAALGEPVGEPIAKSSIVFGGSSCRYD